MRSPPSTWLTNTNSPFPRKLPPSHTRRTCIIFRLRHAAGIGTPRPLVSRRWRSHGQGFVRPLLVVLAAKLVEGPLLHPPVGRRRTRRLLFQSTMHSFVPPVLLGMSRLDPLRHDVQLHPVHRQTRQSGEGPRGERRSIIGADRMRHTVLPKGRFRDRTYRLRVGLLHRLATQQITTVRIAERERIDALAVADR